MIFKISKYNSNDLNGTNGVDVNLKKIRFLFHLVGELLVSKIPGSQEETQIKSLMNLMS